MYEYKLNNNEKYPEDRDEISIFSFEPINNTEFENIVKDAFQLCEDYTDYVTVAEKIVEIDSRFFFPKAISCAYIGTEDDDYSEKIRGFYHFK